MGVVAAVVVVVVDEVESESGSLRVVALEDEKDVEDAVGGLCRCEVLVGVGCWAMAVGCWLLLVRLFVLYKLIRGGGKMEGGPALSEYVCWTVNVKEKESEGLLGCWRVIM